jgi:GNAT superfamily N-acetyltransferase
MTMVRTIDLGDVEVVADLTARVFGKSGDYAEIYEMMKAAYVGCPYIKPEHCWVVDVDGRIVVKWQLLDLTLRVGSAEISVGGAQALVAEPDENGKGYPRLLVREGLPQAIAAGFDVLLGFAQRGAFYRRLGAAPVMAEYELGLDPRKIPRLSDDPFEALHEEDVDAIVDQYNRSNARRTGTVVRTTEYWHWMVRRAPVVLTCSQGYFGARFNSDSLELREVAGEETHAFCDLVLRKLGEMARARGYSRIQACLPPDHPLAEVAQRYAAEMQVRYPDRSGCLALVINPESFLKKLRPELERRLSGSRFGDVRVDLRPGSAPPLRLNSGGAHRASLDLDLSLRSLLQLAFGYRSAGVILAQEGIRLDGSNRQLLEVLFPQGHPFMWLTDRF